MVELYDVLTNVQREVSITTDNNYGKECINKIYKFLINHKGEMALISIAISPL